MTPEEKQNYLFILNLKAKYQLETAAKCIKPCFKNFSTPVVTETESDCMTNCVSKGLEAMVHLQLQQLQHST
jgi:hypothetical protein